MIRWVETGLSDIGWFFIVLVWPYPSAFANLGFDRHWRSLKRAVGLIIWDTDWLSSAA